MFLKKVKSGENIYTLSEEGGEKKKKKKTIIPIIIINASEKIGNSKHQDDSFTKINYNTEKSAWSSITFSVKTEKTTLDLLKTKITKMALAIITFINLNFYWTNDTFFLKNYFYY